MKVLLITSKYHPEYSGSGHRARATYRRLACKFGVDYQVLSASEEFDTDAAFELDGRPVRRLTARLKRGEAAGRGVAARAVTAVTNLLNYFIVGVPTIGILRRARVDLIHTFGDSISIHTAVYFARWRKIPLLREMCNQETSVIPRLPFRLHRWLRYSFPEEARVVSISPGITEKCRVEGVELNRIWERPNPVDESRFTVRYGMKQELRTKLTRFGAEDRVILCVSKMRPSKNQLFLIDVLAELPEPYTLFLSGPIVGGGPKKARDHAYLNRIVERVAELGLEDRVQINTEFVTRIEELYAMADVFAFPTLIEALGTPMLESIACGLPVVANPIPGVTERWIENGRNGYLCKPEAEHFAQCIVKALGISKEVLQAEAEKITTAASTSRIDGEYISLMDELING